MSVSTPTRELVSPANLAKRFGDITEAQIRGWLHNRERNGFAACVIKPSQRRIYIDVSRFEAWLEKRTQELAPSSI